MGFSREWKDGKFQEYKKIRVGFPGRPGNLWATARGREAWGQTYDKVRGIWTPIPLREGQYIELAGRFVHGAKGNQEFRLIANGCAGGFKVLSE
ncbi:MAG: hypothetical protein Q8P12_04680, partial [bacterium]|nr:hypothetical protein [bacterium]